jgi:hypothetical protein
LRDGAGPAADVAQLHRLDAVDDDGCGLRFKHGRSNGRHVALHLQPHIRRRQASAARRHGSAIRAAAAAAC